VISFYFVRQRNYITDSANHGPNSYGRQVLSIIMDVVIIKELYSDLLGDEALNDDLQSPIYNKLTGGF
jgi:hypothetical protein